MSRGTPNLRWCISDASTCIHGAGQSFPILLTQKVPHQRCLCNCFYEKDANALKFALTSLCLWSCCIEMPKSSWFLHEKVLTENTSTRVCVAVAIFKWHHQMTLCILIFVLQWRGIFLVIMTFFSYLRLLLLVITRKVSRYYEKISRYYEKISRYYDFYSRYYDFFLVITRNISRYYDFCFS